MIDEWAIPENLPAFFLIDITEVAKLPLCFITTLKCIQYKASSTNMFFSGD